MKTKIEIFQETANDLEFEAKMFFREALNLFDMGLDVEHGEVCQHCLDEHVAFLRKLGVDIMAALERCAVASNNIGLEPAEVHGEDKVEKAN